MVEQKARAQSKRVWKKGELLARILRGEPSEDESEDASTPSETKQTHVYDRRLTKLSGYPTSSEMNQLIPVHLGFDTWDPIIEPLYDESSGCHDEPVPEDDYDWHEHVGSDCWTSFRSLEPWSDGEAQYDSDNEHEYNSDGVFDDEPTYAYQDS